MGENIQEKTARISQVLERLFGIPRWPGPTDPLESLIKTILSQNTNDRNRDRAYNNLRLAFPTWDVLAAADVNQIAQAIKVAGLANQRAARLKDTLGWVKETFGGWDMGKLCSMEVEEALTLLTSVAGVGVKTAAVVLLFSCGRDIFPVDTHVNRICQRLGLVPHRTPAEKTFQFMAAAVPPGKSYSLHLNMIRFGRTRCYARNPDCSGCPLRKECTYPNKEAKPRIKAQGPGLNLSPPGPLYPSRLLSGFFLAFLLISY